MVKLNVVQLIVHAVEYYLVLKSKDVLTHATAWMNLEDTVLNEISQTQIPYDFTQMRFLEKQSTSQRQKVIYRLPGTGGKEGWEVIGCRVSVWGDGKILEMDSGNNYTPLGMYLMLLNCKFYVMNILPP